MRINIKETAAAGLGNNAIPAGYNQPNFGVGTAVRQGSPNPDAQLAAASAAITPNGIDPLNKGYQIGGANDPLAEFEPAKNNPPGMDIGGGKAPAPISSPCFPPMASSSFKEDGVGVGPDGSLVGSEAEDPFAEDNPFKEDDAVQAFETSDAIPTFEDVGDDPALAALPVDANGVIQPIVVPDEVTVEPELGQIPDAALPFEEPILDITEDDIDVAIPENAFENDGMPEAIPVVESFKLPENQDIIVSKGDQIFVLGRVREEFTPKFAEGVFSRALKSLVESKGWAGGVFLNVGRKREKAAIVGRSALVEVAKDWRLPGTNAIFEAHDLLQIVSARPVHESEEADEADAEKSEGGKSADKAEKSKKKDELEAEKAKKEYYLAKRRWLEAKKKQVEDDEEEEEEEDDDGDPDKVEKKKKKERARREAESLERQRAGGWI
jgi:hypothetical protein